MKRFISLLLVVLFVLPIIVACENDIADESSFNNELSFCDFKAKIGSKTFEVGLLNCTPDDDRIVVYTKDYRLNGKCSPIIGVEQLGRKIISVRAMIVEDEYEFDIVGCTDDVKNGVIPRNGFALSIPIDMLTDVRLNVGQLIKVEGFLNVCPELERIDLATIAPDYLISTASRRVNLIDPVNGFENDKIYCITNSYKGSDISVDNITVTVKKSTQYSCEVLSIEKKDRIDAAKKGEMLFVFTGEYNIAYAEHYLKTIERISFSNLDKCNSYSDKSAIILDGGVIELNKDNLNTSDVKDDGVYFYDSNYSSAVTPKIDSKRIDIVIVDDYVVDIANECERTFIPEGGGFVVTLVGENFINKAKEFEIGKKIDTCFIEYFKIPDNYVEINGVYFGFDFQNGVRAPEGVSVIYTSEYGKTTGSNIYGSEIVVDNGKVTSVNIGKGDSQIPEGGFVLSIHKDSDYYRLLKKVKIGDDARIGFGGDSYGVNTLKIDGVNTVRSENTLILYRDRASTQTNPYGYEIAIDKDGISVSDSYNGNISIPKGGFVLSGHGTNKTSLEEAFAIGQKVILDSKNNTVVLIKTPKQRIENAKYNFDLVCEKLDAAKKAYLNIDYKQISTQFELMKGVMKEAEDAFASFDFEIALEKAQSVISTCENLQYTFYESNGVENRAVWYRSTEKNDDAVRATINKMKSLNINALYLETWYEGYCIGSKVEIDGISKPLVNDDFDVLESFIRIGHENGIEVHAWVHNFFVGYYYKDGRNYYNKSFDAYKDKYLVDIKGRDFFYYSANNNYFIFLNAFDRECRDLILNIYEQLISKYDLDGLHLDYVRMPELNYGADDFGYNEDIINAFSKETGITKDPRTFVKNSAEHKKWVEFRCNIITSFVGEVYDMARKVNPEIWLSAAMYPDLNMAKNDIFQDVRSIINKGYLDEVFSMSYGVDESSVMPSVKSYNSITENKVFYSAGIAAFLETTEKNFALQLDSVTDNGADGVSIFALASITPGSYYKPITDGAFRSPSVQVDKLSVTARAQMEYIKNKVANLSDIYQTLNNDDIEYIMSQCDEIIEFSNELDVENDPVSQKIAWCNSAMSKLASAKSNIISRCGDNIETDTIISEIKALEYWLKISALRLSTRQ